MLSATTHIHLNLFENANIVRIFISEKSLNLRFIDAERKSNTIVSQYMRSFA